MVVCSLYSRVYTPWGRPYDFFNWDNFWSTLLAIADKELRGYVNHKKIELNNYTINHLLSWYNTNVLQAVSVNNGQLTSVRIRIACGMVDKVKLFKDNPNLARKTKECFTDTYRQFYCDCWNCYCKLCIDPQLPF